MKTRLSSLVRSAALLLALLALNTAPASAQNCQVEFFFGSQYAFDNNDEKMTVKQKYFPLGFGMSFRSSTSAADVFKVVYMSAQNDLASLGLGEEYEENLALTAYRNRYSDLQGLGNRDLLQHWYEYGKNEGRDPSP